MIKYDYLQTNWGIHDTMTFFNMFFFTDYAQQLNDIKRFFLGRTSIKIDSSSVYLQLQYRQSFLAQFPLYVALFCEH